MFEAILLYPRPLARSSGRLLLLPLLPHRPPLKPLPSEIWYSIFMQVLYGDDQNAQSHTTYYNALRSCSSLMMVCKGFKASGLVSNKIFGYTCHRQLEAMPVGEVSS